MDQPDRVCCREPSARVHVSFDDLRGGAGLGDAQPLEGIVGRIDDAHPAFAQHIEDHVATECRAGRERASLLGGPIVCGERRGRPLGPDTLAQRRVLVLRHPYWGITATNARTNHHP